MNTHRQKSLLERTQLKCALVETYNVVKAYRASLDATTDATERHWLQEGLRKALGRAWEHKLRLDTIHEQFREAGRSDRPLSPATKASNTLGFSG